MNLEDLLSSRPGKVRVEQNNRREEAHRLLALEIHKELDGDLAHPWADLEWQKRTGDGDLLLLQQIRLQRQIVALLEQLRDRRDGSEARSNG
ncbi:hypothetical protein VLK31_34810 [Variovorax sp. H27-G14]|uniref:hypothetical protein n=1 Tax=Variovorax sp. H27-G14 TaxID=3111914 RepID=UPI0038FC0759